MLPKIEKPIYELTLPLSKKKIQFTPFTVKEQKILLMALEANDIETMERNILQVLNNCTVTEGLDIQSLPLIDVEYFFLHLRARSVGEIVENKYKCNNKVDDKECGNIIDVKVNLLEIQPEIKDNISDTVKISDNLVIKFNYPEYGLIKRIKNVDNVTDFAFNMMVESIDYIHDGEQFYYAKEIEPAELVEFMESLSQQQFEKVEEFFNNLPSMKKTIKMKCGKCGFEHSIDVEGVESFFG